MKFIYNYVNRYMRWNGRFNYFTKKDIVNVYHEGTGNSIEVNLIMAALLHDAGLSPKLILTCTNDNGFVYKDHPLIDQFNHLLCLVSIDETDYYLDAVTPNKPFDVMPYQIFGCDGIVLDKKEPYWVTFPSTDFSTKYMISASMNENMGMDVQVQGLYQGYSAIYHRNLLYGNSDDEILRTLLRDESTDFSIDSIELQDMKDVEKPVRINGSFTIEDYIVEDGEYLYLNPFLGLINTENPFKSAKRLFPIEFNYPTSELYLFAFRIPEGYEVDKLPIGTRLVLPDKSITASLHCSSELQLVQIKAELKITKRKYKSIDYFNIKELYRKYYSRFNDLVILVKSK